MTLRLCTLPGCDVEHFGLGLCQKHYRRQYRCGDPLRTRKVRVTRKMAAAILAAVPGRTDVQVAQLVGCSRVTVGRLRRHRGVPNGVTGIVCRSKKARAAP